MRALVRCETQLLAGLSKMPQLLAMLRQLQEMAKEWLFRRR